jgi:hypothetical protein
MWCIWAKYIVIIIILISTYLMWYIQSSLFSIWKYKIFVGSGIFFFFLYNLKTLKRMWMGWEKYSSLNWFSKRCEEKKLYVKLWIDVCFHMGQILMSLFFLKKWCEKKIGYFLSKNVFALLGSKFDVRIFEKRMWKKIKFYQKLL